MDWFLHTLKRILQSHTLSSNSQKQIAAIDTTFKKLRKISAYFDCDLQTYLITLAQYTRWLGKKYDLSLYAKLRMLYVAFVFAAKYANDETSIHIADLKSAIKINLTPKKLIRMEFEYINDLQLFNCQIKNRDLVHDMLIVLTQFCTDVNDIISFRNEFFYKQYNYYFNKELHDGINKWIATIKSNNQLNDKQQLSLVLMPAPFIIYDKKCMMDFLLAETINNEDKICLLQKYYFELKNDEKRLNYCISDIIDFLECLDIDIRLQLVNEFELWDHLAGELSNYAKYIMLFPPEKFTLTLLQTHKYFEFIDLCEHLSAEHCLAVMHLQQLCQNKKLIVTIGQLIKIMGKMTKSQVYQLFSYLDIAHITLEIKHIIISFPEDFLTLLNDNHLSMDTFIKHIPQDVLTNIIDDIFNKIHLLIKSESTQSIISFLLELNELNHDWFTIENYESLIENCRIQDVQAIIDAIEEESLKKITIPPDLIKHILHSTSAHERDHFIKRYGSERIKPAFLIPYTNIDQKRNWLKQQALSIRNTNLPIEVEAIIKCLSYFSTDNLSPEDCVYFFSQLVIDNPYKICAFSDEILQQLYVLSYPIIFLNIVDNSIFIHLLPVLSKYFSNHGLIIAPNSYHYSLLINRLRQTNLNQYDTENLMNIITVFLLPYGIDCLITVLNGTSWKRVYFTSQQITQILRHIDVELARKFLCLYKKFNSAENPHYNHLIQLRRAFMAIDYAIAQIKHLPSETWVDTMNMSPLFTNLVTFNLRHYEEKLYFINKLIDAYANDKTLTLILTPKLFRTALFDIRFTNADFIRLANSQHPHFIDILKALVLVVSIDELILPAKDFIAFLLHTPTHIITEYLSLIGTYQILQMIQSYNTNSFISDLLNTPHSLSEDNVPIYNRLLALQNIGPTLLKNILPCIHFKLLLKYFNDSEIISLIRILKNVDDKIVLIPQNIYILLENVSPAYLPDIFSELLPQSLSRLHLHDPNDIDIYAALKDTVLLIADALSDENIFFYIEYVSEKMPQALNLLLQSRRIQSLPEIYILILSEVKKTWWEQKRPISASLMHGFFSPHPPQATLAMPNQLANVNRNR